MLKAPPRQRAVVDHFDIDVARVVADALDELEHRFLRAFELLAKALAVKDQQAGDVELRIHLARPSGNLGDHAQGLVGREGAHVKNLVQGGADFHRCGPM